MSLLPVVTLLADSHGEWYICPLSCAWRHAVLEGSCVMVLDVGFLSDVVLYVSPCVVFLE